MKVVLDTNLFTNPAAYQLWGDGVSQAIDNFIKLAKGGPVEFLMPPSVYQELGTFFEGYDKKPLDELAGLVTMRSPYVERISIPAGMFYDVVLEIRQRSYKGLRIAEKYLTQAISSKTADPAPLVAKLRHEYRQALRGGFLDSRPDLDLLFLAYEEKAFLATVDQGLIKWADRFGVKLLSAQSLKAKLS